MRWLLLPVSLLAAAAAFFAQTAPPNAAGVSAGHVHIVVADPAAYQKTIISVLGGTPVNAGPLTMVKLPGMFFIMTAARAGATPVGGSQGSVIDHVGFSVKNFAAVKAKAVAAGLSMREVNPNAQALITFPNDVVVEVQEDPTLTADTVFSHYHLSVTDTNAAREWYMKTFGGVEAHRRPGFNGVGVPGAVIDFMAAGGRGGRGGKGKEGASPAAAPAAPPAPSAASKGRYLDHIGFEVKDLDAFVRKLDAEGIKLDVGPLDMTKQAGLKIAFLTDPYGTYIELTEGLAKQ